MEALHIEGLKKSYTDFSLGPIDIHADSGYIVAVIGKNGCGKSTLFDCMLGMTAHEGECRWVINDSFGKKDGLRAKTTAENAPEPGRSRISFVLERCPFPKDYSPNELAYCYGSFYRGFDRKKYLEFCRAYHVPMNRPIRKLSRGLLMMAQIAFAFSYDSEVLILDEPTAHLDGYAKQELYKKVSGYAAAEGHMVFWSSHLMEELDRMADYVLGIKDGKQMFFMTKEELLTRFCIVKGSRKQLDYVNRALVGRRDYEHYSRGLMDTGIEHLPISLTEEPAGLSDIVEYLL